MATATRKTAAAKPKAAAQKSVTVYFDHVRDTQNKVRFDERTADDVRPVVGPFYMHQDEHTLIGQPKVLKVLISAA